QSTVSSTTKELKLIRNAVPKLAALQPPSNLRDEYAQWLGDTTDQLPKVEALLAAGQSGDTAKAQALAAQIRVESNANSALARKIGLTECAKEVKPQG